MVVDAWKPSAGFCVMGYGPWNTSLVPSITGLVTPLMVRSPVILPLVLPLPRRLGSKHVTTLREVQTHPSIDHDALARRVGAVVAGQEQRHLGHFLGRTETAHRHLRDERLGE